VDRALPRFHACSAPHDSLGAATRSDDIAISRTSFIDSCISAIRDVVSTHYNRYINGVQSPVIPICNGNNAPGARRAAYLIISGGRTVSGLLVKGQTLSHRFQMQVSYASRIRKANNGI